MTPLTTKAAEIRAGLVDRLREHVRSRGGLSRDAESGEIVLPNGAWAMMLEAADLIEQQAAELAEKEISFEGLEQLARRTYEIECEKWGYDPCWDDEPPECRKRHMAMARVSRAMHRHEIDALKARATTAESERDEARAALQVAKDGWRDAEDAAKTLAAERDELLREKERMGVALSPFAQAAADCDVVEDLRIGVVKPADVIWESAPAVSITFGHLAAAQSALENGPAGLADAHSKSPDQPERDTGPRFNERAGSEIAAQRQQEEREPNGHRKNSCSEPGGNSRPLGEE